MEIRGIQINIISIYNKFPELFVSLGRKIGGGRDLVFFMRMRNKNK